MTSGILWLYIASVIKPTTIIQGNFMKKTLLLSLILAIGIMILSGCDDDKKPTTATIKGTVTFKNVSVWKASGSFTKADEDSGEVEVTIFADSVWKNGPGGRVPYGAPYNANNPVVFTRAAGDSTYQYEIEVEPGTYSALAVGFRTNRAVSSDKKTATLGVHWGMPDSVSHGIYIAPALPYFPGYDYPAPAAITVEAGDELTLNFKADFGFVNSWFH